MILHSATRHGNHSPFGVVVSMLGASWSIMENMQQPCGFALNYVCVNPLGSSRLSRRHSSRYIGPRAVFDSSVDGLVYLVEVHFTRTECLFGTFLQHIYIKVPCLTIHAWLYRNLSTQHILRCTHGHIHIHMCHNTQPFSILSSF